MPIAIHYQINLFQMGAHCITHTHTPPMVGLYRGTLAVSWGYNGLRGTDAVHSHSGYRRLIAGS